MSMRGADVLVQTLRQAGTRYVFTLSGNHVMPVFDAALDSGIELVHVRHEAAAVHMADAWARMTGAVGIALVTGGPGHANAVSALYTARESQSPVLLISGHAPRNELGRGAFQEMAQAAMAEPVVKSSRTLEDAESLHEAIVNALRVARGGWPGPVHLSVPVDVLESIVTRGIAQQGAASASSPPLHDDALRALEDALRSAARPLVILGPVFGAVHQHRVPAQLADATGIPVVVMESPRGLADANLGVFADVCRRADAAVLIGKRRDYTLRFGQAFDPACRVFEWPADIAPADLVKALTAAGPRLRGAHEAWRREVEAAVAFRPPDWPTLAGGSDARLHPLRVCAAISRVFAANPDAVLVADGGEFSQWVQGAVSARHRIINGTAGAIGVALPFAVAAKLARRDAPVIAVMGDGSFGFHMSEIDTAVRYGLAVIAIVGNDACWNAEYQIQLRTYGAARAHGCELLPTRYDKVAEALGAQGLYADSPATLEAALARAVEGRRPTCINVPIQRTPAPKILRP